jgi:hypothetical protein
MLKFQLVALAKSHNYLGAMDQYMKEFSRIVMDLGDRSMISALENALNSEIVFEKGSKKIFGDYHKYPREIDPAVLQIPGF